MRLERPSVNLIHPFMVVGMGVQDIIVIDCYEGWYLQSRTFGISGTAIH